MSALFAETVGQEANALCLSYIIVSL